MITFRLQIASVDRDAGGAVVRVFWRLTGRDPATGREQEDRGSVVLEPNQSASRFIPFGQLTDRRVKAWIKDSPALAVSRDRIAAHLAQGEGPPAAENVPPPWHQ